MDDDKGKIFPKTSIMVMAISCIVLFWFINILLAIFFYNFLNLSNPFVLFLILFFSTILIHGVRGLPYKQVLIVKPKLLQVKFKHLYTGKDEIAKQCQFGDIKTIKLIPIFGLIEILFILRNGEKIRTFPYSQKMKNSLMSIILLYDKTSSIEIIDKQDHRT